MLIQNQNIVEKFAMMVGVSAEDATVECTPKGCVFRSRNQNSGRVYTPRELKAAGFDLATLKLSDPDLPESKNCPSPVNAYPESTSAYDDDTPRWAAVPA